MQTNSHHTPKPPTYWLAVREDEVNRYHSQAELLEWISEEGEFRAASDILEVIERRDDGTAIIHNRATVDAWCAEREREELADRWAGRQELAAYQARVL